MADTFDYIIIGAGSAGCVLANRLSAGDATVCLLEAGGRDINPMIHIPAGFMKTLTDKRVNWLFQSEPGDGTAGRRIPTPRGKVLGGSSSINGHVYNRGPHNDFNTWSQMGNRGWGYADVLPYFRRSENRIGDGNDGYHGHDGELAVTDIDEPDAVCDAFIKGVENMGIPRNPDYNGAKQAGVGYFQRTIRNGRRMSAAVSFLNPVKHRKNLEIRTHAHVERILFEGNRAVAMRYRRGGTTVELRARREIILSGGSVASPQLLQVSGVGPAGLLKDIGVPVIHELSAVGENLSDHYAVRIANRIEGLRTINERARGLALGREIGKWLLTRKGILSLSPSLAYVFWKSHESLEDPDLQFIFTPASYKQGVPSQLEAYPGITIACWTMRPRSRGHIQAKSANMQDAPAIQPNYLAEEYDRQVLLAGLRLGRRMVQSPELAAWYDHETTPGKEVQSDDEILDYARAMGTTVFHLMGSCRMGPASDNNSVVDEQLRVHGIEGLRVVDASIIPTAHSTNTNAAVIMIAEKASDMILGKQPLPAADL
jgi:choline dehydrogenase